jgi:Fe-S-cluster containining protein
VSEPLYMNVGPARCDRCEAVCCRLNVVLVEGDDVPPEMIRVGDAGERIMKHAADGWCVAAASRRCSIYDRRPQACRRFAMAGPYCRALRTEHADRRRRGIPLQLY